MIGQKKLITEIEKQIDNNTFPRFSILVGPRGSGKKLMANYIANTLGAMSYILNDVSIASIRTIIDDAYRIADPTVYIIPDADNMSVAARNAMLKVVEEPPNNAYFIMTLENENNTLSTIRSRGTVFHMDRYTPDEIFKYYWSLEGSSIMSHGMPNDAELVRELCETPGEVDILVSMDITGFYDYVELVVDNIASVSGANAFKIADKVALKEGAEGYDLRLFWKAFIRIVMGRYEDDADKLSAILVTNKALEQLRIKGINRLFLMDKWILDVRQAWMED